MPPRFAIRRIDGNHRRAIEGIVSDLQLGGRLGRRVFLKPNFTFPHFHPGVTTTREFIVAVVEVLRDLGVERLVVGEGDGGYNLYSVEDTFRSYRLEELRQSHGIEVVNVFKWPSTVLNVDTRRGRFDVNIPRPLVEDFDTYITLPVPKVHAMTYISNALKNQWGLVQDVNRLYFHCGFDEIINEINLRLPNPVALVDGTFGLTHNGPMVEGKSIELGWVSGCDNLWLNDLLMCDLMRVPHRKVDHLQHALKRGLVPDPSKATVIGDFQSFIDDRFYLKRNIWNRVAKLSWYSRPLNHLFYFSALSGFLHTVMYRIRPRPAGVKLRGVDW